MIRFKVFDVDNARDNGEGVQFSDGLTVLRVNGVFLMYPPEIQAQVIPLLEAQRLRLEWMDMQ